MKIHTLIIAALGLLTAAAPANAATPVAMQDESLPCVQALQVERSDNKLFVSMLLDFSALKLKSNREIAYTPILAFGDSILELPQVVVAGRNRYIQHERHNALPAGTRLFRAGGTVEYSDGH